MTTKIENPLLPTRLFPGAQENVVDARAAAATVIAHTALFPRSSLGPMRPLDQGRVAYQPKHAPLSERTTARDLFSIFDQPPLGPQQAHHPLLTGVHELSPWGAEAGTPLPGEEAGTPLPGAAAGTPPAGAAAAPLMARTPAQRRDRSTYPIDEQLGKKRLNIKLPPFMARAQELRSQGFIPRGSEHVQFTERASGTFQVFATINPDQPRLVDGWENESLGLKFFHTENLRRINYAEAPRRIVTLHGAAARCGIPLPEIFNSADFLSGCGYLIIEKIPLPPGELQAGELLSILLPAYENNLLIDLSFDNLGRREDGSLVMLDWGGDIELDDSRDVHFRTIIRQLLRRCNGLANAIRINGTLTHLLP